MNVSQTVYFYTLRYALSFFPFFFCPEHCGGKMLSGISSSPVAILRYEARNRRIRVTVPSEISSIGLFQRLHSVLHNSVRIGMLQAVNPRSADRRSYCYKIRRRLILGKLSVT